MRYRQFSQLAAFGVLSVMPSCSGMGTGTPTQPGAETAGSNSAAGNAPVLGAGGAESHGGAGGVLAGGGAGLGGVSTGATGGSAGTSAGGASMGGTEAGSGGGTAGCIGLICEDFESGKVDAEKWDLVAKGGTLVVQGEHVAHGSFAAQAHGTPGPSDDWALLVAKNVPASLKSAKIFGRVMMYATPDETASIHVQMAFAGHTGTGSANGPAPFSKLRYMEVASNGTRWQLGFDLLDLSPLVEEVSYSSARITTSAWLCLEWQFEDDPDRITEWVDGTPVSTFDNTNVGYASPGPTPKPGGTLWDGMNSGLIGGFDTFGLGFHDWHPQKQFDIYYDDFVLDTKRVGCPAE